MIVLVGLFRYFVYRQEDMLKALDNLDKEEKKDIAGIAQKAIQEMLDKNRA